MGSRRTHRELVSRIAREAAAQVLVSVSAGAGASFPAAVEDATAPSLAAQAGGFDRDHGDSAAAA
jgi:hypothetical protein